MDNGSQIKTANGQETVGFVLSIICIVLAIITISVGTVAIVNITLALATLAFGLAARRKAKTGKSMATIIIGAISLLLGVVWVFI